MRNTYSDSNYPVLCTDKSDHIYPVLCTNTSEAAQYCNTFCPQGVNTTSPSSEYVRVSPEYDDDYGYFKSVPSPTFTDTAGNTVETGYRCEFECTPAKLAIQPCQDSCTGQYNYTCSVSGNLHCLHPALVCDGHPHCDQGEDEELSAECIQKLVKLNTISNAATQKCKSIKYKSKKTVMT